MKSEEKTTIFKKKPFGPNFFWDFAIVCFATFGVLYLFGFVPNELKINNAKYPDKASLTAVNGQTTIVKTSVTTNAQIIKTKISGELPTRIKIDAIGVDANIYNPETTDEKIMDADLLHGAVRYPGSGLLAVGNLFLFGHSTGFKVVNNQAYKTFNGLGKLKVGDKIFVYSSTAKYIYSVINVAMKPASMVEVDLSNKRNMLTLSTCDVFGAKEDRYVVEADFVAKD